MTWIKLESKIEKLLRNDKLCYAGIIAGLGAMGVGVVEGYSDLEKFGNFSNGSVTLMVAGVAALIASSLLKEYVTGPALDKEVYKNSK